MAKRIGALLLVLALALTIMAGCGEKTNTSGKGSAADSEDEFFYDVPEELNGVTVKYATWIDHTQTESAQVMADFTEITGINVELVSVVENEYTVKLAALIAAGQSPDFIVDNGHFPTSLALLQPLVPETTGINVTDDLWDPTIVDLFTIGKYTYALNTKNSTWSTGSCVYYNNTVLEENGVKTPQDYIDEDNWNLDTFYACAKQIQNACGYSEPATAIDEYRFAQMFNTSFIKFDSAADKYVNNTDDPNLLKAYQYLLKGREEKIFTVKRENRDNIADGRGAMSLYGVYGLRKKPGWYYKMNLDDLAFAVLPKINASDADYPRTQDIRAYGVCKGAAQPLAAGYFLRYYTNSDHYDLDATFKNEEAQAMYKKLMGMTNVTPLSAQSGALSTMMNMGDNLFTDITDGTSAQLTTNISSASNRIQGCVDKANELIQDCISQQ